MHNTTSVKSTGKNTTACVVYTGEQLIAGVVDTGDKHRVVNISANFFKNLK